MRLELSSSGFRRRYEKLVGIQTGKARVQWCQCFKHTNHIQAFPNYFNALSIKKHHPQKTPNLNCGTAKRLKNPRDSFVSDTRQQPPQGRGKKLLSQSLLAQGSMVRESVSAD